MKIVNLGEVERFGKGDKRARSALQAWVTVIRRAIARKNFADIKRTCGSVDKVGRFYVFDVGGNKYRVIAEVDFEFQLVRIVSVLDHKEYDRGKWREK